MDWFLYDKDPRHERVKYQRWRFFAKITTPIFAKGSILCVLLGSECLSKSYSRISPYSVLMRENTD